MGRVTYPPCVGGSHSWGPWRRAPEADERAMAEQSLDLLRDLVHGGHVMAPAPTTEPERAQKAMLRELLKDGWLIERAEDRAIVDAPTYDLHWWHPIQLAHIEATGRFPLYDRRCLNPECPQDGADQRSPQHPDHPDHPFAGLVAGKCSEGLDKWLSP